MKLSISSSTTILHPAVPDCCSAFGSASSSRCLVKGTTVRLMLKCDAMTAMVDVFPVPEEKKQITAVVVFENATIPHLAIRAIRCSACTAR